MNVFDLYAKISLDTSDYESGLTGASSKTNSFGSGLKSAFSTIAKVGAAALAAATTAIVAFGKSAIEAGSQFDSSMSQVAATMGVTVDEIQNLRDFAMEMGAKTAFSASQAADALNYMALAGYDAEESMEALPTVLNLAAAGGMELATASDMVTDAQSALGLSMEESAEMVDKMAMASSKSNTSVSQLGEAILTIGGTAKNLAGGTTELSTALGILADNGIKGAEGGTHLRNVILSLTSPTDTAAAALSSLGVEVFDADGNMRPLNETLGDLNSAMSSMTQADRTNIISTIFNKTDISAVNALLANTGERWDELSGYIDDAAGSAEKMANTQLDNLNGDVTLFKSALEGAQILVSDKLTPSLREFVQFGTDGLTKVSDAFKEGGLSGAMEAFGEVLSDAISMAIDAVPQMIEAGGQLLGALAKGLVDNAPQIIDAAVEVVEILASGLISSLPEIGAAAVEIATTFVDSLWSNIDSALSNSRFGESWDSIKKTASDAFDKISEAGAKLVDAFSPITDKIAEIKDKFDEYAESGQLMTDITNGITTVIDVLATGISTVITGIASFAEWLTSGSAGASAFQAAVVGIVAAFTAYEIATTAVSVAQTVMHGAQTLLTAGQTALNAVMNANPFGIVALAITAVVAAITYLWNTNEEFREAVISAWETIKDTAETIWNAVAGFFTETIPNAINKALEYFDSLMNGSMDDMNAIEAVVSTVMNNISTIFSTVMNAIKGIVNTVLSVLKGDWSGALNSLKSTASTVFDGIKTVISNKINLVKTLVGSALDVVKGYFSDKLNAAKTIVSNIFDSIKTAISDKLNAAKSTVQDVIEAIKSKFNFSWSLPKLKLPHISISGSFSLAPPSVPSFSISWYKKAMDTPYLLSGATIFGAMGGQLLGGGEAGSEIVAGTATLMDMIREAAGGETDKLLKRILETLTNLPGTPIIINGADYNTTRELAETVADMMHRDVMRKGAALA